MGCARVDAINTWPFSQVISRAFMSSRVPDSTFLQFNRIFGAGSIPGSPVNRSGEVSVSDECSSAFLTRRAQAGAEMWGSGWSKSALLIPVGATAAPADCDAAL